MLKLFSTFLLESKDNFKFFPTIRGAWVNLIWNKTQEYLLGLESTYVSVTRIYTVAFTQYTTHSIIFRAV